MFNVPAKGAKFYDELEPLSDRVVRAAIPGELGNLPQFFSGTSPSG